MIKILWVRGGDAQLKMNETTRSSAWCIVLLADHIAFSFESLQSRPWDRKGLRRLTETVNQVPVILQETAVPAAPCNVLWTSQVDVDGVAVRLDDLGCSKKQLGIVSAELQ